MVTAHPLDETIRAGADRVTAEVRASGLGRRRARDAAGRVGECGDHRGERFTGDELYGVFVDGLDVIEHIAEVDGTTKGRFRIEHAIVGPDDSIRIERLAVMEGHAFVQLERELERIVGDLPGFREEIHDPHLGIERHQTLVNALVDTCRGIAGRVLHIEVIRLHAESHGEGTIHKGRGRRMRNLALGHSRRFRLHRGR